MNPNHSEILCIVDRSGSMRPLTDDTIGGFNSFLEEQQAAPGEANLSLILFDHEYLPVYERWLIDEVEPLNRGTYVPRGNTALLDAVGRAINELGALLDMEAEQDKPAYVIVAIITDGQENNSREFTKDKVAAMIKEQQEKYHWTFLFMGANIDAFAEAGGLNIPAAHTMEATATPEGTRATYAAASRAISKIREGKDLDAL